jgi:hypothetical protein
LVRQLPGEKWSGFGSAGIKQPGNFPKHESRRVFHCALPQIPYLQAMKKSMLWLAVALAPVLLINPVSAQESSAPKAKKAATAKTPTLSFYYYDG